MIAEGELRGPRQLPVIAEPPQPGREQPCRRRGPGAGRQSVPAPGGGYGRATVRSTLYPSTRTAGRPEGRDSAGQESVKVRDSPGSSQT